MWTPSRRHHGQHGALLGVWTDVPLDRESLQKWKRQRREVRHLQDGRVEMDRAVRFPVTESRESGERQTVFESPHQLGKDDLSFASHDVVD